MAVHEIRARLDDKKFKRLQQAMKATGMSRQDYVEAAIREKMLLDSLVETMGGGEADDN